MLQLHSNLQQLISIKYKQQTLQKPIAYAQEVLDCFGLFQHVLAKKYRQITALHLAKMQQGSDGIYIGTEPEHVIHGLNNQPHQASSCYRRTCAVEEALLDANMLQNLVADLLHYLGTGVICLVNSVPEAHQPETSLALYIVTASCSMPT